MLEKAGIAPEIFNPVTGALMTTTVAVFAIGGTATLAIVQDMQALVDDRAQQRKAAEEKRREAERLKSEAEQQQKEVAELNAHLETKAKEYQQAMTRAANGDLTARVDTDSQNDSMAEIAEVFNTMVADLEDTIVQVRAFAKEVSASSEAASDNAEEAQSASKEVNQSIQEIMPC
ncbi:HAMP domain-containing protein [Halorubrum ezzemoulense]|uniref:HAMP domain-containing protein n=1 Tax=Halorubrum ezzemoulense TaxID=337243 RepID=UPI00200A297E|nr:HAMP domain-containing protein [Halorubrum ezzemoulense]